VIPETECRAIPYRDFAAQDDSTRILLSTPTSVKPETRLSGGFGKEFLDFIYFFIVKPQIPRTHDAFSLFRVARSNNRAGDGGMMQRPRDGDFADGTVVTFGDLAQAVNQR
jgi:hypothetical protein